LAAARVLGEEEPGLRGLDVVRLVDLAEGLDRVVIPFDRDRQRGHARRILRVEHHLPDPAVRRTAGLRDARRPTSRVHHVDHVAHPGTLVVRDVLDADEVEHVVELAPVLEHPLGTVDAERGHGAEVPLPASVRRRQGVAEVCGLELRAIGVLPGGDVLRHLDEVSAHGLGRAGREVVVVVEARVVRDERPEVPVVGEQLVRVRRDVRVQLGLGRRGRLGVRAARRDRERPAREGVVAREHDQFVEPWDRDVVLVVVPAHPVDRLVVAGAGIEREDDPVLLLGRVTDRRRPRVLLPEHVVRRLLVDEEDVLVEPLLARRQVVGAEALEPAAAVDGERTVEDATGRVQGQQAHLRVVEVALGVARAGGRRDVRERDLARLVVHVQVDPSLAVWIDRDPVRDRFEPEAIRQLVPHGQQGLHRDAGLDRGEHRGLFGPEASVVGRGCGGSRDGHRQRERGTGERQTSSHASSLEIGAKPSPIRSRLPRATHT
jgi:hypothetical protein